MLSPRRKLLSHRVSRRSSITRTLTIFILISALGCAVAAVTGLARSPGQTLTMSARQAAALPGQTATPALAMLAGATITVNSTDDVLPVNGSDGKCTLREAITAANTDTASGSVSGECVAGSGNDTINFEATVFAAPGPHTINLKGGLPSIDSSLVINGPGAKLLTVRRDTGGEYNIFGIQYAKTVTITGLTITNGFGSFGGGISNDGTLTVNNCAISGNTVAGGVGERNGGGIGNTGTLTVNNSTISGNTANAAGSFVSFGGGIYSESGGTTLTINNSTISGNGAKSTGGGILIQIGQATLTNVTISNNRSDINDVGGNQGGGVATIMGSILLRNTIVAGNFRGTGTTTQDVSAVLDPTSSYNIIGAYSGSGGLTNGVNGNQIGTPAAPLNARLAALADNGGPTQTHALLAGSPALDQGSNDLIPQDTADLDGDGDTTEPVPFDQRGPGYARKADAADADTIQTVDIGAFEAHPSIEDITDKTTDEDTPLYFSFNFGDRSLGIKDVTATSSNTALMANGGVDCFPSGSTCTYFRAPVSNQSGSAVITITITANNDAVMTDSFNVTVNPVNDPPSFTKGLDQGVNEDAGARNIPGWAMNISAGPSDESGQTLTFITTNDSNSLFAVQPTIGSDGTLSYRPAADASGVAHVTVVLKDDGGGADTSAPQTFTIIVDPVNDAPANTAPAAQITDEDIALTFSAATANLISISDIDAGSNPVKVTLTATNGALTLSGTTGLSFTPGDGTADATMTFSGAITSINAALSGLVFTPTAGFHGAASVQITTNDLGNTGSGGALTDTDTISITVNERTLQFSSTDYTVGEADGHATITVTRLHGTTGAASVQYSTSDLAGLNNCNVTTGDASARCDYTAVGGTLNFAAGQTSLTFSVPIINDVYVEGPETLTLTLSNPTGGALGTPSTATLTITDNDTSPGAPNPIDQSEFLIREHYLDFLDREPEPQGLQDWLAILNNCPAGDIRCDEIEVSSDFFRSPEFFDRSYFVYRFYEVALGRHPLYDEYQRDIRSVTGFLTEAEKEARKQQFIAEFMSRQAFRERYDAVTDPLSYVAALDQTAGVHVSNEHQLILDLANGQKTRGEVLRAIVESPEASQRFYNKAFVVVGYFAYLRRDPDSAYLVWLNKLNTTGDYREMIRGFLRSTEYRSRFGPM